MKKRILAVITAAIFLGGCAHMPEGAVAIKGFEKEKYLGKWYEIARLPNSFEKGLVCCTAEYGLRDDGKISVINAGVKEESGKISSIKGKAWVPDPEEPGRLKVQFFWPFAAGYYIFHLDKENYQYALVGTPNRKYLWILARSPIMDDVLYKELVEIARKNEFQTDILIKVRQDCE